MKKLRTTAIVMLCISLLAFAGCGGNNNDNNTNKNNSTVTEESRDMNNSNNSYGNDSLADDMADGIDRAADDMADGIDDVTDDLDGKGNSRDTVRDNSNESVRNN